MKKIFLLLSLYWLSVQLLAQNTISIQAGFLGTHTSVAEYTRAGRYDNLLDSVRLKQNIGSFQALITTDLDMGKNFIFSTGFHFAQKGIAEVSHTDSTTTYITRAYQNYVGLSAMIGYHIHFKKSKFGLQLQTGPQVDFAVGTPNNGALFSGCGYKFFNAFCRFNEVDLSWVAAAGVTYRLGPGDMVVRVAYLYGLSDVLEDAYIIGRSMSVGITMGYSIKLSKP